MPKKYHQKSLLTKPSPSASSSLSLSRTGGDNHEPAVQRSVNDLIHESRKNQDNKKSVQYNTTPASIHPTLRAVLDLPAPAPPAPRHGLQGSTRTRRMAGPPPPRSWITHGVRRPASEQSHEADPVHAGSKIVLASRNLPGSGRIDVGSLQHLIMKRMAQSWQWHAMYDHEYLTELPVTMREDLLRYIAVYSDCYGTNPLQVLFPENGERHEYEFVQSLDLSNAIGSWSSMRKIERDFCCEKGAIKQQSDAGTIELPDSWDDIGNSLPKVIETSHCRFSRLKHLSLAVHVDVPPSSVSWQDLVSFAAHVQTLKSLSLAHWPRPTYTPNASTGWHKINSTNGPTRPRNIVYGGSNFYSAFDKDWRETAGILRSLSRLLYCLTWLDLTGCGEWWDALLWRPEDANLSSTSHGPDWNGSWRDIEHLILAVGWMPQPLKMKQAQSVGCIEPGTSMFLPSGDTSPPASWDVDQERETYRHRKGIEKHTNTRDRATRLGQELRRTRREMGGKWIEIDVGSAADDE